MDVQAGLRLCSTKFVVCKPQRQFFSHRGPYQCFNEISLVCVIPGPSILALISVISTSFGKILMPSGGSFVKSAISLAICLIICGDRFSTFDVEH